MSCPEASVFFTVTMLSMVSLVNGSPWALLEMSWEKVMVKRFSGEKVPSVAGRANVVVGGT